MSEGKIICVAGAPRTGKSFLVEKLATHYNAEAFFEGEDGDFPDRIKEDISKNIRPLERILWFRNRLTNNYKKALAIKANGGTVISDTAYFAVDLFVDVLTEDAFEREILHDLAKTDEEALGMPDKIIHLISNESRIKEFLKLGGREFDAGADYYETQILPLQEVWSQFLENHKGSDYVLEIDRSELDFENEADFQELIRRIES